MKQITKNGLNMQSSVLIVIMILICFSCSKNEDDKVYSGSWTVKYEYGQGPTGVVGIAEAATAVGENGVILGRAKLLDLVGDKNKQLRGVKIEEIHYDMKGNVKYKCTSLFDFPLGRKTKETDTKGIKHTDYFSSWPVVSMPMGGGISPYGGGMGGGGGMYGGGMR